MYDLKKNPLLPVSYFINQSINHQSRQVLTINFKELIDFKNIISPTTRHLLTQQDINFSRITIRYVNCLKSYLILGTTLLFPSKNRTG